MKIYLNCTCIVYGSVSVSVRGSCNVVHFILLPFLVVCLRSQCPAPKKPARLPAPWHCHRLHLHALTVVIENVYLLWTPAPTSTTSPVSSRQSDKNSTSRRISFVFHYTLTSGIVIVFWVEGSMCFRNEMILIFRIFFLIIQQTETCFKM